MSLKKLNSKTEYEVIPSYSVLIIQDENRVVVTAQEIARLHVESSVAPDSPASEITRMKAASETWDEYVKRTGIQA